MMTAHGSPLQHLCSSSREVASFKSVGSADSKPTKHYMGSGRPHGCSLPANGMFPNIPCCVPGWGLVCSIACWAPPSPLMPNQASLFGPGVPLGSPLESHSLWHFASTTPPTVRSLLFDCSFLVACRSMAAGAGSHRRAGWVGQFGTGPADPGRIHAGRLGPEGHAPHLPGVACSRCLGCAQLAACSF